jgi:hypothetical protein
MPYKPTGNPPGRPRKTEPVNQIEPAVVEPQPEPASEPKRLERAREGFRRAALDPAAALHHPPRYGARKREVGKRPILHPNVIGKT